MEENKVRFNARIGSDERLDKGIIRFPYDVLKIYGVKGEVKVKGVINGDIKFKGTLAKSGTTYHTLEITGTAWKKLRMSAGETVSVVLEPDEIIKSLDIPEDISRLLRTEPRAGKFFESLPADEKKKYLRWIEAAQSAETRQRRSVLFIEKLKEKKRFMD